MRIKPREPITVRIPSPGLPAIHSGPVGHVTTLEEPNDEI